MFPLVMIFHSISGNYSCIHIAKYLFVTSDKIYQFRRHKICMSLQFFLINPCQTHSHNICCSWDTWILVNHTWLSCIRDFVPATQTLYPSTWLLVTLHSELAIDLALSINFILYVIGTISISFLYGYRECYLLVSICS